MDIMQILKIVFVIMCCVPIAYLAYALVEQLIDQLAQTPGVTRRSSRSRRAARKERKARRTRY